MMQPLIGDNHPWAGAPLAEPIMKRRFIGKLIIAQDMMGLTQKTNQRWRKNRQRFFFALNLKGGDSM